MLLYTVKIPWYTKEPITGAIATHNNSISCIIKIILWFCNFFNILFPAIIPVSKPENAKARMYFQKGVYSANELKQRILKVVNTTNVAIEKNTESNTKRLCVMLE
jgi:hypothetical protein